MMLQNIQDGLKRLERRVRTSFGNDLSTPKARRQAWWHFNLFDHAFLRVLWTNFYPIADGAYRSNHPGPARLAKYHRMGIKTVLNLRGNDGFSPWLLEEEACEKLGMSLVVAKIYARKPAKRAEILNLIDTLKTIDKPFVLHCKSGADRAGFAAVLYAHIVAGQPLAEARKHLHWKYLHLSSTKTGIVDHIIDMYEDRLKQGPIPLEEWFATEYDAQEAKASFKAKRSGK